MRYNCQNNFSYARSIHSHQRGNLLFFARTTFFACTKMNATRGPIREVAREKIFHLYGDFRDYFGGFFPTSTISKAQKVSTTGFPSQKRKSAHKTRLRAISCTTLSVASCPRRRRQLRASSKSSISTRLAHAQASPSPSRPRLPRRWTPAVPSGNTITANPAPSPTPRSTTSASTSKASRRARAARLR